MIRFDIITIFPSVFAPVLNESIIKRAQEKKKVQIRVYDLRAYSRDKHKKVDDRPFGGGPGMVMTPQPLFDAVKKIKGRRKAKVLLMCPGGTPLTQTKARALARERNLILICGHYEGVDERVRRMVVDESLSVGDYILTGGELPAMIVVDAVTRLIPGVLGKEASLEDESFERGLLEYPHYTRPADFRGAKVPEILLSGHHADIVRWRQEQAVIRTKKVRPDLLKGSQEPERRDPSIR
ncbi:MAG TPA: tRNA (guanosine(37)-N1)-methyltransferase TrmD [Candidatus Omnitrophota bacterium]|nr:tRNA (guanosine(37)-N1)-methyltransferase TrmD [Candidatus Omnitrophota bacterium]HQO57312.1 tRNA (guanosine(37)-N1)-methyltransferase TrmD [Candidatus Omnitrophota bacterium]